MYFELKHHAPQLKRIVDDQHARLGEAQEKISKVEKNQTILEERIDRAVQQHNFLEQRLQRLRNMPGAHKKPLSRAERNFKSELGNYFLVFNMNLVIESLDLILTTKVDACPVNYSTFLFLATSEIISEFFYLYLTCHYLFIWSMV